MKTGDIVTFTDKAWYHIAEKVGEGLIGVVIETNRVGWHRVYMTDIDFASNKVRFFLSEELYRIGQDIELLEQIKEITWVRYGLAF